MDINDIKLFTHAFLGKCKVLKALHTSNHFVFGPYISEVGTEIQYWVPFLQFLVKTYNLKKENITVISRGGSGLWYTNVADHYLDAFDYVSLEEFRTLDIKRKRRKQLKIAELDRLILDRASHDIGRRYTLIHPSSMAHMFAPFWMKKRSHTSIQRWMYNTRLSAPSFDPSALGLPPTYVAAKFYFSDSMVENEENKKIISSLIQRIARKIPVVLLDTGFSVDDHWEDYPIFNDANIYTIRNHVNPRNNLDIQTKVVSHATAFIGTYGGFSCIAPVYGVPSFPFYSDHKFPKSHLEIAQRTFSKRLFVPYIPVRLRDMGLLEKIFSL